MKQTYMLFSRLSSTLSPFRHVSRAAFGLTYSTATATATAAAAATTTTTITTRRGETLFSRISPLGTPGVSITPVIDKWVDENKSISDSHMRFIISELRNKRRFSQALEVSEWMSEKRPKLVSAADIAFRLDLIAIVRGVEAAENYFNAISEELRTAELYGALLNRFAYVKCADKAESVMQTMRDLGFVRYPIDYNVMLNLYSRTGNREKLDAMLKEMEAKKIKFDSLTYSNLLNAYGGDCDIDGMERILTKMESDPEVVIDWKTYIVAARQFLRAELADKALESLRKSEKLVGVSKKKNEAYSYIIYLYASVGKKEEVLRVWEECKKSKLTNRDYTYLLPAVLKFDDMETAEKVFNEWRNSNSLKDIRIPNFLISAYCEKGMVEKAEALLDIIKSGKWQKPESFTWYCMSHGYVKSNQMPKALEAIKLALSESNPRVYWKARQETLAACIRYLKDEGDLERLNAIINSLKEKCAISAKSYEKLVEYVSGKCDIEDMFEGNEVEEFDSSRLTRS